MDWAMSQIASSRLAPTSTPGTYVPGVPAVAAADSPETFVPGGSAGGRSAVNAGCPPSPGAFAPEEASCSSPADSSSSESGSHLWGCPEPGSWAGGERGIETETWSKPACCARSGVGTPAALGWNTRTALGAGGPKNHKDKMGRALICPEEGTGTAEPKSCCTAASAEP